MRLEITHVGKHFATETGRYRALSDINLTVADGQFVCLLGPSGCGKSTLLRMVAGLEFPSEGRITFDGKPVTGPSADRGLIFQEYNLFPWRSVLGNVEFGLELQGLPPERRRLRAIELLSLVGLDRFAFRYPHQLSGGMRQRVAIARALATDPKLLLLDEPFGALDAQTRKVMQAELLRIWERTQKTVLFVTHSVEEAVYLADTLHVFTAGPGRVKGTLHVRLPRPRVKTAEPFLEVRRSVLGLLDEEVFRSWQQQEDGVRRCST